MNYLSFNSLGFIVLFLLGSVSCTKQPQRTKAETVALKAEERHNAILAALQKDAIYDETTGVSYVLSGLPTDRETLTVAARNGIYFAEPGSLLLNISSEQATKLQQQGYTLENTAIDVYRITFDPKKRAELDTQFGPANVLYDYHGYMAGCFEFNDAFAYPKSWAQGYAFSTAREDQEFPGVPTLELDQVNTLSSMHKFEDNVVINIFDSKVDTAHPEFTGRFTDRKEFRPGSPTIVFTNHGTGVASLAMANANNNIGLAGVANKKGIKARNLVISISGNTFSITALYNAQDYVNAQTLANPNQHQINNYSLSIGNDQVLRAKMLYGASLHGGNKQINFGAAGNTSHANIIAYPGAWTDIAMPVGSVVATDPSRPVSGFSNKGQELRTGGFVMDGENVKLMSSDGSSYYDGNGTSFSSPIVAGIGAVMKSKDTSLTLQQMRNDLARDAKDYGPVGPDTAYGLGYPLLGKTLKNSTISHMPSSINAGVMTSFQLIPKFYNGAKTTGEKVRINGRSTTISPTFNAQGEAVFQLNFTPAQGFTAGENLIEYEFEVDGCNMSGSKNIFISNFGAQVITIFTFTGSGNYNLPGNWSGGIMPPNPLPAGSTIIINGSGECILNVPQTISAGATLNIANGARLRIMGNLIRQ